MDADHALLHPHLHLLPQSVISVLCDLCTCFAKDESRERIAELHRTLAATGQSHAIIFDKILASTDRDEVKKATQELLDTLKTIKQIQSNFEVERTAFERKIQSMTQENASLEAMNIKLESEVKRLESMIKMLTDTRESMKIKHEKLMEDKEMLQRTSNTEIQSLNSKIRILEGTLEKTIGDLKQNVDQNKVE